MALKNLILNNSKYLHRAFDPEQRKRLIRSACVKRTVYLVICWIGVVFVVLSGLLQVPVISCLSLLLCTLSLVCFTKYDTQLLFLTGLEDQEKRD